MLTFCAFLFFNVAGIDIENAEWETLLNSNLVYDIAPVTDGAWLATNGGVRFFSLADSSFTESYTNVDGLPHNLCRAIVTLPTGQLWVGTDRGLVMIEPSSRTIHRSTQTSDQVFSLALAGDSLAVGTSRNTFIILMRGTPADFSDDGVIKPISLADRNSAVVYWFNGELWFGAPSNLGRYNPQTNTYQEFDVVDFTYPVEYFDVRDIDAGDSLDILLPEGVFRFAEGAGFHEVFTLPDTLPRFTSMVHTGDTVYVSSASWSSPLDPDYARLFRFRESVDSLDVLGFRTRKIGPGKPSWGRYIQSLQLDKSDNLWLGLGGSPFAGEGLIVWDQEWSHNWEASNWFAVPGLNSNYVNSLSLDEFENLWAVHWVIQDQKGITRYYVDGWENFRSSYLYHDDVVDTIPFSGSTKVAAVDSRGRAVFGAWSLKKAVSRYDPYTGQWDEYDWGEGANLNIIAWLAVDPSGRVWVSHFNATQMSVLSEDFADEVVIDWPHDHVYSIEFDSSGTVWAGTDAGLVSYTPPRFDGELSELAGGEFSVKVSGPPEVWDIACDGDDGVWGVTSAGAFHWTPAELREYSTANSPLPENEFVSVERDPWGRVYILCRNRGVVVYDPAGVSYDTSCALWQLVSPDNNPLINGFEYSWMDVNNAGQVAVGTFGGGVSLFRLPSYVDTTVAKVSVYPNPCYLSNNLPVRFVPVDGAESVTVYTISGELLVDIPSERFSTIQSVAQAELDVSNLASGLYLAVIRFPDRVEKVKFVILR